MTVAWVPSVRGSSEVDNRNTKDITTQKITQDNVREYNPVDTLQFTCNDFDRLQEHIKWDIVPAGEGLPLNTEMKGGLIWLKELQLNLTNIFCILEKGDLHW